MRYCQDCIKEHKSEIYFYEMLGITNEKISQQVYINQILSNPGFKLIKILCWKKIETRVIK